MTNSSRLTAIRALLSFGVSGPCCNFLGADAPTNCRKARQDLWT